MSVVQQRDRSLDAFRGLAILAMVWDHLFIVFEGSPDLRMLFGRFAMPAFFVLAGHLARSPRWRHAGVVGIGLALPLVVPWIDSPNVLVLWGVGVVLLWVGRQLSLPVWLFPLVALALFANGYPVQFGTGYDVAGLVGLMGLGAMIPRSSFAWAARAPRWVGWIGARPIWCYVGHLVALQLVLQLVN